MRPEFECVRDCIRAGAPVALATVIELERADLSPDEPLPPLGAKIAVRLDVEPVGSLGDPDLDRVVVRDVIGALDAGHSVARHYGPSGQAGRTDVTIFIEAFAPPPQMVIIGAVDFTAALVRVAKVLGYHVVVCDARAVFATPARFPEADEVIVDWPHRYLAKVGMQLGRRDAICVLTHDHKFDVPAILAASDTDVGYIGAMGSRKTHEGRVERLRAAGASPEALSRLMAPIGLDIGARTPEEIAVSICAEIISLRTGREALSLRDASGPIHGVAS